MDIENISDDASKCELTLFGVGKVPDKLCDVENICKFPFCQNILQKHIHHARKIERDNEEV